MSRKKYNCCCQQSYARPCPMPVAPVCPPTPCGGGGILGTSGCGIGLPALVILILVLLQFRGTGSCKVEREDDDDECETDYEEDDTDDDRHDDWKKKSTPIVDNGILFIIAIFYLTCCGKSFC